MYSSSSCLVVVACARLFLRLVLAAVQLPALLCFEAMACALAFLTFPLRVLAAADRERKLDRLLGEMQAQMEKVVWENRQLESQLRAALKEQAALEDVLDEMDQEHDQAFARIRLLENQIKALKKENLRLRELKGKAAWDKKVAAAHGGEEEESRGGGEDDEEEKEGFVFVSGDASRQSASAADEEARQLRLMAATARRRSLFSVGMSAAVGGVAAWAAAEDATAQPCLPLLAGLLAVVAMSMCSVARLFRVHGRCPTGAAASASGAVALLSLNWFLLGVLTYPMLPGVARAVLPSAARLAGPALAWLAAAVPL